MELTGVWKGVRCRFNFLGQPRFRQDGFFWCFLSSIWRLWMWGNSLRWWYFYSWWFECNQKRFCFTWMAWIRWANSDWIWSSSWARTITQDVALAFMEQMQATFGNELWNLNSFKLLIRNECLSSDSMLDIYLTELIFKNLSKVKFKMFYFLISNLRKNRKQGKIYRLINRRKVDFILFYFFSLNFLTRTNYIFLVRWKELYSSSSSL